MAGETREVKLIPDPLESNQHDFDCPPILVVSVSSPFRTLTISNSRCIGLFLPLGWWSAEATFIP
jgi:hypothetical protein